MELDLTPEQTDFVRHAVETGRVHDYAHAVRQAMSLWVERERRRIELLARLDVAEASLARGNGGPITQESMLALAEDVKHLGREHLAARNNARP